MLNSLLQSHPEICCHGEVFGPRVFQGFQGVNYKGQVSESHKPPIVDKLVELRSNDPVAFLRDYVLYPGDFKAVGLKFKYEELAQEIYTPARNWLRDTRDIKVIHLTRRNLLKRYASQFIATKITNVFNVWEGTDAPAAPRITLSPAECEREFLHTEQRYDRFDKLFQKHDVFNLTYEELIDDKERYLTEIQAFLGLEPVALRTGMKKINPDSLRVRPESL
jgi:hypothetical protein